MYAYVIISQFIQWNFGINELLFTVTTRQRWYVTERCFPIILFLKKIMIRYFYYFIRSFYIDHKNQFIDFIIGNYWNRDFTSQTLIWVTCFYWASYSITKVYLSHHCLSFEHFLQLIRFFIFFLKMFKTIVQRKGILFKTKPNPCTNFCLPTW